MYGQKAIIEQSVTAAEGNHLCWLRAPYKYTVRAKLGVYVMLKAFVTYYYHCAVKGLGIEQDYSVLGVVTFVRQLPFSLHSFYMSWQSHLPWLDHSNYTWQRVQFTKLLIMQFSPTSCYLVSLRYKYSPQHRVLKRRWSILKGSDDGV
jgi:hypothetical protein